jgi:hypothetical protein
LRAIKESHGSGKNQIRGSDMVLRWAKELGNVMP